MLSHHGGALPVRLVITETGFQVVAMHLRSRVPRGVGLIPPYPQLDQIPAVGFGVDAARYHADVYLRRQRQPVQQQGIALRYRTLVHQCRVGGILQQIRGIVPVFAVIFHMGAEPVINGRQPLLRLRHPRHPQIVQQRRSGLLQLRFLPGGGEIGKRDGHTKVIAVPRRGVSDAAILIAHVVAAGGILRIVAEHLRQQLLPHQRGQILGEAPPQQDTGMGHAVRRQLLLAFAVSRRGLLRRQLRKRPVRRIAGVEKQYLLPCLELLVHIGGYVRQAVVATAVAHGVRLRQHCRARRVIGDAFRHAQLRIQGIAADHRGGQRRILRTVHLRPDLAGQQRDGHQYRAQQRRQTLSFPVHPLHLLSLRFPIIVILPA